jgi:hypothetical protein
MSEQNHSTGFTDRQRQAILERDNFQGQMRHYSEDRGWFTGGYCDVPLSCQSLHVHHITPQRILSSQGFSREQINSPENLITLYSCEHTGQCPHGVRIDPESNFVVHPDVIVAMHEYGALKGQAFENMASARNQMIEEGIDYWNTDHDAEMYETAVERTNQAVCNGWHYPGIGR